MHTQQGNSEDRLLSYRDFLNINFVSYRKRNIIITIELTILIEIFF